MSSEGSELLISSKQKETNLITNVQPIKRSKIVYLYKDAVNERLDKMPAGREKLFIQTLWMTGIRITEALNIRKRDIDFQRKLLTIRWLKSRKWKDRVIPIRNDLCQVLEVYSLAMLMDDLLFPFNRLRGWRISKEWMFVNPHALRHSYGIHYLLQGGRMTDLKQLMGHNSINTTMIYVQLVPNDLKESIEKIQY